jgi:hypothetical protein
MKQSIPTPVFAGIIIVVAVIALFFGYRAVAGGRSSGPTAQSIQERIKENPNAYRPSGSGGMDRQAEMRRRMGGGGMSGGMMSGGR